MGNRLSLGLFGLVVWPPKELSAWIAGYQRLTGAVGYGPPNLNLRSPFEWEGEPSQLTEELRAVGSRLAPFQACISGWQHFSNTIYLGVDLQPELQAAHRATMALSAACSPDQHGYVPHVTCGLGICSWAMEDLWRQSLQLSPPRPSWQVRSFDLTREVGGEIVTMLRVQLRGAH